MAINPIPTPNKTLPIEHFPTKFQALIFRLWECVPAKKIAEVLKTTEGNIRKSAFDMGLCEQEFLDEWRTRGYISIIRSVFNLLPYEQILELLDYDEERFNFILKEDDFLGIKLGEKCDCKPVYYRELTAEETARTAEIKATVEKYIKPFFTAPHEKPFDFFNQNRYEPICIDSERSIKPDSTWSLEYPSNDELLLEMIDDFKKFANKYGVKFNGGGKGKIVVSLNAITDDEEYHEVSCEENLIKINAATATGALRGIYELENRALNAGSFSFDKFEIKKKTRIKTRFIYSFCGLYTDALDCDTQISFPDELLEGYGRRGVNGVWLQGILYKLSVFPFQPEISAGWEERLKNLDALCKRAARYGIKIYLYMNEPRRMPLSFFEKYPELKGSDHGNEDGRAGACLCSSNEKVKKYLHDSIYNICSRVRGIGGFLTITQSENSVTCYSRGMLGKYPNPCPVCSKRNGATVTGELVAAMANGALDVDPKIKFFAYAWGWTLPKGFLNNLDDIMTVLPKNVSIIHVSENQKEFTIGGFSGKVSDYSMSIVGPSDITKYIWEVSKRNGLEFGAKIQINNTWECSTAPFLPVYDKVVEHMEGIIKCGIQHLMLSWTLGGYISDNLKIASAYFFEDLLNINTNPYDEILKTSYGKYAEKVKEASTHFCRGFSEYPFCVSNMYSGPSNAGVANLLYPKPSNMKSTMTCYIYDDLNCWLYIHTDMNNPANNVKYTKEVLREQYRLLYTKWEKGLEIIKDMPTCEFKDMAYYGYNLFKASYDIISYIMERDGEARPEVLREYIASEKELAVMALEIMMRNSAVGYEAANHYYFTRSALAEKIIQCEYLLNK